MTNQRRRLRPVLLLVVFGGLVVSCSQPQGPQQAPHPLLSAFRQAVPVITITTADGSPVESKEVYSTAWMDIDGLGVFGDFSGSVDVRGRGNSTWAVGLREGKKPYRLRLTEAGELLGLPAERNWILLANYLDVTLMGNVVAFATAHLLDMPFTHNMIPVELVFNGEYMGSYLFTEHKEVKPNRIDIGDEGVLLELDTHFDEPFKFISSGYNLPVLVQHPDLERLPAEEADQKLAQITSSFSALEQAVAGVGQLDSDLADHFDAVAFAKYMVVFQLTANRELNHPKSVYMYRLEGGPFQMGPIWDFDWAYGYNSANRLQFVDPTIELIQDSAAAGSVFFAGLMEHKSLRDAFKHEWAAFREELFPTLIEYIWVYGAATHDAYARDYERWFSGPEQFARSSDFEEELSRIVAWMEARAVFIDSVAAGL